MKCVLHCARSSSERCRAFERTSACLLGISSSPLKPLPGHVIAGRLYHLEHEAGCFLLHSINIYADSNSTVTGLCMCFSRNRTDTWSCYSTSLEILVAADLLALGCLLLRRGSCDPNTSRGACRGPTNGIPSFRIVNKYNIKRLNKIVVLDLSEALSSVSLSKLLLICSSLSKYLSVTAFLEDLEKKRLCEDEECNEYCI